MQKERNCNWVTFSVNIMRILYIDIFKVKQKYLILQHNTQFVRGLQSYEVITLFNMTQCLPFLSEQQNIVQFSGHRDESEKNLLSQYMVHLRGIRLLLMCFCEHHRNTLRG